MPADQADQPVDQAVDNEHPGEEEVPVAAVGQVAVAGQGRPGGEGDGFLSARLARIAQDAGGVEFGRSDPGDANRPVALLLGGHRHPGVGEGRLLAPVESRMGAEDVEPAHQQQGQRQRIDPVGQAGHRGVAVDQHLGGLGHGVRFSQDSGPVWHTTHSRASRPRLRGAETAGRSPAPPLSLAEGLEGGHWAKRWKSGEAASPAGNATPWAT